MISLCVVIIEFLILSFTRGANIAAEVSELADMLDIVFIAAVSLAIIVDLQQSQKLNRYSDRLFMGYLLRLFLLVFDLYGNNIYTLPNSGADSEMFYNRAVSFAMGMSGRKGPFEELFGTIFKYIGTSRMYGQFLVILFSMVALCTFAMIVDEIDVQEWSKQRAITVVSLLPNFAILSSIFLRESLVTMWITVSLYFFFRWFKSGSVLSFAMAFGTCFLAAVYHSGSVACVAGYVVVMMLYDRESESFTFSGKGLFFAAFFLIGFVFLFVNYGDVLFGKMMNVDSLGDIGNTNTLGRTSYAQYVGDSSTPIRMAIFTLPRIFFFLFSPLPWMWGSIGDIIAFVFSSLFYFFTVVKAFKSMPYQSRTNKCILVGLLVVAACSVFVFAWGVSTGGTAARHRDKMVCLFGLIYLLGCDKTDNLMFRFGGRII